MYALASVASALLLGAATVNCHPSENEENGNVHLTARKFERRATFECPIFDNYEEGYKQCSTGDLIWDNEEIFGKYVTFYVPPNEPNVNETTKPRIIEVIQEAVGVGLELYQNWAPGITINIGLVGEIQDGSYGWTLPHTENGVFEYCNILINFPLDSDPDYRIRKAVTHELYHCIQAGINYEGQRYGTDDQNAWWIEGTARFFDGVTYPIEGGRETLLELGTFPEEYDPYISLVSQSYATALFFHFLVQGGVSLDTINSWVGSKVGRDTPEEDLIDVSEEPLFAHNWHGFARRYVDNDIQYNAQVELEIESPAPYKTYETQLMSVGDIAAETYILEPFTFGQLFLTFPAGSMYYITLPDTVECSVRRYEDELWHPATGKEFTVDAGLAEMVVEVIGSCADYQVCVGEIVIERIS